MLKAFRTLLIDNENRAVAMAFMSIALAFGAWVTRLPEIKGNLHLSEAELGTALFFIPLGGVTLLPFYARIIQYLGEKKSTTFSLLSFLVIIVVVGQVESSFQLMICLYLMGLTMGLTDVAMNAAAVEVENQRTRIIMSACHGFFSLGGMVGALLGSLFIYLDQSLWVQSLVISLGLIVIVLGHDRYLLNSMSGQLNVGFEWPKREVLLLAFIGLCIMMCEGGITDWSTIYLKNSLNSPSEYAGLGFAGFSLLMAVGRFSGDELTAKFGRQLLVLGGAVLAAIGLLLSLIGSPILAVLGFSLAGLGYSIIVPTLFSAAAKVEGVSSAKGIASVASAGYIGLLVGPVVIGFIAESFGLSNGFLFLIFLTFLAFLMAVKRF